MRPFVCLHMYMHICIYVNTYPDLLPFVPGSATASLPLTPPLSVSACSSSSRYFIHLFFSFASHSFHLSHIIPFVKGTIPLAYSRESHCLAEKKNKKTKKRKKRETYAPWNARFPRVHLAHTAVAGARKGVRRS